MCLNKCKTFKIVPLDDEVKYSLYDNDDSKDECYEKDRGEDWQQNKVLLLKCFQVIGLK